MKELEELDLTEKDLNDFKWWLEAGKVKDVYEYIENWKFVTDTSEKFLDGKVCCICGEKANGKYLGSQYPYCSKHYRHLNKYGKIISMHKNIPNEILFEEDYCIVVTKDRWGKEVTGEFKVDDGVLYKLLPYRWSKTKSGYAYSVELKGMRMHRLLLQTEDSDIDVDHKNNNTYDNRLDNLRLTTHQQNLMNAKLRSDNMTGFTGVSFNTSRQKYLAFIYAEGQQKQLGRYENIKEAITARLNAEVKYYGKYAPQIHLYKEYSIDDSSVEYDPPYKRPCDMFLKRALELYELYIK